MTRAVIVVGFVGLAAGMVAFSGDHAPPGEHVPEHHIIFTPQDVQWKAGPASLAAGAQYAVLEGDPSKGGLFTMRLRLPDGFRIMPHWHPNVERVTVVSGVFHLGSGDTFSADATRPLPAGSYTSMPPEMRHFAYAEGETVLQLTAIGPWKINYINPADDPRSSP